MWLWVILEGSALFAVAIAFAGVPLWLVMAGISRIADLRSKDRVSRDASASGEAPRPTRFGRAAKRMVFGLIAVSLLAVAVNGGQALLFHSLQMPGWLEAVFVALIGSSTVLTVLIAGTWVAIVADMLITHRVAGRDTKIAYGVVGVLCVLETITYIGIAMANGG
jgi:hypothetical protein